VTNPDAYLGIAKPYQVQGEGYLFTADPIKFQKLDFNRKDPSLCQVEFEIKKVKREGNKLTLEILRPKDCIGTFELVWDGVWQESSLKRMQVYLTAQFSSCASSSETEVDVIRIDLAKVLQNSEPMDPFTLYLREHCSFRDYNCVGDCDLVIPG
jgi:hypothetical protein